MCMGAHAPPSHPTASLNSAQAQVPQNLGPASMIQVKAYATQVPSGDVVEVNIAPPGMHNGPRQVALHDDGLNGDRLAQDGEWYGELKWGYTAAGTYHMWVILSFQPHPRQPYYAPQFTNLPDVYYAGDSSSMVQAAAGGSTGSSAQGVGQ